MKKVVLAGFQKVDHFLFAIEKAVICISLTTMLVIASTQVILRNVFHTGITWGEVFVRHMVLFLLFFGASLSTRNKTHIQMDVSTKITPKKLQPTFNFVINLFCILITSYLAKAALMFFHDEKAGGGILFANVPEWVFIAVIPVGFILLSVRFSLNAFESLCVIMGLRPASTQKHGEVITTE